MSEATTTEPAIIVKLRRIVDEGQNRVIQHLGQKARVDLISATMLLTVYDALGEANQAKFVNLPLFRMVDVGWKCVRMKRMRR